MSWIPDLSSLRAYFIASDDYLKYNNPDNLVEFAPDELDSLDERIVGRPQHHLVPYVFDVFSHLGFPIDEARKIHDPEGTQLRHEVQDALETIVLKFENQLNLEFGGKDFEGDFARKLERTYLALKALRDPDQRALYTKARFGAHPRVVEVGDSLIGDWQDLPAQYRVPKRTIGMYGGALAALAGLAGLESLTGSISPYLGALARVPGQMYDVVRELARAEVADTLAIAASGLLAGGGIATGIGNWRSEFGWSPLTPLRHARDKVNQGYQVLKHLAGNGLRRLQGKNPVPLPPHEYAPQTSEVYLSLPHPSSPHTSPNPAEHLTQLARMRDQLDVLYKNTRTHLLPDASKAQLSIGTSTPKELEFHSTGENSYGVY